MLGRRRIILEGYALEVVNAVNHEGTWVGRYGAVIQDAKELQEELQEWQVHFVRREANSEAHRY